MQDHDTTPKKSSDSIDVNQRLREIEKQRRIILEATGDERVSRCMRMVGCDLVATQRDFQRASELPETAHEGLLTGGAGDSV
jgi:hypothetical protein